MVKKNIGTTPLTFLELAADQGTITVLGKSVECSSNGGDVELERKKKINTVRPSNCSPAQSLVASEDRRFQLRLSRTSSDNCSRCGKTLSSNFCLCLYKIPLQCEKCQVNLTDLKAFQLHMSTHPKLQVQNLPYELSKPSKPSLIVKEIHRCLSCKESFETELGLRAHSLNHLKKSDASLSTSTCSHCNREFPSTFCLSKHITRMHMEKKKFNCSVCNKGFSSNSTLEAHNRLHSGIKPHKCDICGKCYSQSGNLAYHKSTHLGVKSYVCHICGKAFLTGGILATHERRHSGLKPFVCDMCERAFADNYALTHHKANHSGIRAFMCDVCGKSFIHKQTLMSHERIHSGEKRYRCSICDRAFTQMSTMLQHHNTHTREKSHHCFCGKAFTQQSSLARHKRMHDGRSEPLSCQLCEKKFAYKSTLYKHKRRAHGIVNPVLYL